MSDTLLPPPVSVDKATKGKIIAGVNDVLKKLQAAGLVNKNLNFETMLDHPNNLDAVMKAFQANREACGEIFQDASGAPVLDNEGLTTWGVSVGQIIRLLVTTCAKRYFYELDLHEEDRFKTKTTRSMVFFKKTEKIKLPKQKIGQKKFQTVKHLLGFEWQLPLMEFYRDELPLMHLIELGEDIIRIQSIDKLRDLIAIDPKVIKKAREITKGDFVEMILARPEAIHGAIIWRADMYPTYRRHMGERVWDFYSRDKGFYDSCAELDAPRIQIYGPILSYIARENLMELTRLNLDRLAGTIESFKEHFGDMIEDVLSEPDIAADILHQLVDSFIHVECKDNSQFKLTAGTAIRALKEEITNYVIAKREERGHH